MFHELDSAIDYRKNTGIDREDEFAPHAPRDEIGIEAGDLREQFRIIDTKDLALINHESENPLYKRLAAEEISRRLEEEAEDTHEDIHAVVGGFDVYSD